MDGIIDALNAVGGSEPEDIAACALALATILRVPTRQLVEEWLDKEAPIFAGQSARALIKQGKAGEVALGLWRWIDQMDSGVIA